MWIGFRRLRIWFTTGGQVEKMKVKLILEQAMKAQMESKSVAFLFL
jgi:hypothetical protein